MKIIVTGIGTNVGKTVAAGILVHALNLPYWKPVQTGPDLDADKIRKWNPAAKIFPSQILKEPLSPHHAARLEQVKVTIPEIPPSVIIESTGGVLVPFNLEKCFLDYFSLLDARWIVVSRHYLGSINHTLLTLETLKHRGIKDIAIIFNGQPNQDSEQAIVTYSGLRCIGRILPEKQINQTTIAKYATLWKI